MPCGAAGPTQAWGSPFPPQMGKRRLLASGLPWVPVSQALQAASEAGEGTHGNGDPTAHRPPSPVLPTPPPLSTQGVWPKRIGPLGPEEVTGAQIRAVRGKRRTPWAPSSTCREGNQGGRREHVPEAPAGQRRRSLYPGWGAELGRQPYPGTTASGRASWEGRGRVFRGAAEPTRGRGSALGCAGASPLPGRHPQLLTEATPPLPGMFPTSEPGRQPRPL